MLILALTNISTAEQLPQPDQLQLPAPTKAKSIHLKLMSLNEAIALALRNSPDVLKADMKVVTDKFALESDYNAFAPQLSPLEISNKYEQSTHSFSSTVSPSASLELPTGATIGVNTTINDTNGEISSPTINIKQPLLQGAGVAFNTIRLKNDKDQAIINRLTYRDDISAVVVAVITDYRDLVQDIDNQKVQQNSIDHQKTTVRQQELLYKAGKRSYNDFLQTKQTLIGINRQQLSNKRDLDNAYQKLITDIGLDPSSRIKIYPKLDTEDTHTPDRKTCIQIALHNNTTYRTAVFSLASAKRGVLAAKNQKLWQLDLTAATNLQHDATTNAGVNESTVGLDLTIPMPGSQQSLDDKQGLTSAKIALINARRSLYQAKLTLTSDITTKLNNISNDKEKIKQDNKMIDIDKRTLKGIEIKYRYGKTDVISLTQQVNLLLTDQTQLISDEVELLNNLTDLRNYLGLTLKQWHIKLKQ